MIKFVCFIRFFINNIYRVFEKLPGLNFIQVVDIGNSFIVMFPKTGTRTIRNYLLTINDIPVKKSNYNKAMLYIKYMTRRQFVDFVKSARKDVVVVLRDPSTRLYSCWNQKVNNPESNVPYFLFYWPFLRNKISFESFCTILSSIPIFLMEKHFIPISYFITCDIEKKLNFIKLSELDVFLSDDKNPIKLKRANVSQKSYDIDLKSERLQTLILNKYSRDLHLWKKIAG